MSVDLCSSKRELRHARKFSSRLRKSSHCWTTDFSHSEVDERTGDEC